MPSTLEHGEFWIVLSGDAFVAKVPVDFENFVNPPTSKRF